MQNVVTLCPYYLYKDGRSSSAEQLAKVKSSLT